MIPITSNTNITCNDPTTMIDDQTWTRTGVASNTKKNTLQISIISDNARSHGIIQRVGHLMGSHSDMLLLSFNNNSSTHSTTTTNGTTKCKEDLRWAESSSSLCFLDESNRSSDPSGTVLTAENEASSSLGELQPPNLPSRQSSLVVNSPEPTKTTTTTTTGKTSLLLMRESEAHIAQSQLQDEDDIPHRALSAFCGPSSSSHPHTATTGIVQLRSGPVAAMATSTGADPSVPKLPVRRLSHEPIMSDSDDAEYSISSSSTYDDQDFTRSPLQRVDSRELTFLTMRTTTTTTDNDTKASSSSSPEQQQHGPPRTQRRRRGSSSRRQRAVRGIQDARRLPLQEEEAQPNKETILDNRVSLSCSSFDSGNTPPLLIQEGSSQDESRG